MQQSYSEEVCGSSFQCVGILCGSYVLFSLTVATLQMASILLFRGSSFSLKRDLFQGAGKAGPHGTQAEKVGC